MSLSPLQLCDCCCATRVLAYTILVYSFLHKANWSMNRHAQTMQIKCLSHFLIISELLNNLQQAPNLRLIMVGLVTGNINIVRGDSVYPTANRNQLDRV